MKGLILAAGKGSRLFPITRHVPKPLMEILGKPTIAYAFDRLSDMGIEDIGIVTGENQSALEQAIGDGSRYGVRVSYWRQDRPLGLAHAVLAGREFIGDDAFALYLGDALYSQDLSAYKRRFEQSGADNLSLVHHVHDPRRFGVAELDGEQIINLEEKPPCPKSNWAMAGLYFFGPAIWSAIQSTKPSARGEYEITDAIQHLVESGANVIAGKYEGRWFDTGTLESYLETSGYLSGGRTWRHPSAVLQCGPVEASFIHRDSRVAALSMTACAVMPGTTVQATGHLKGCILGGDVWIEGDAENDIIYSSERRSDSP